MFKKVLIAEDHEIANFSVQKTLTDLGIPHDTRNYVYYCDDALTRIQKALREDQPYELLITDLSFDDDNTEQKISKGSELIKVARQLQPDLKVLVFSIENRMAVAKSLMNELGIDAYVPKARRDAQDLKLAIEAIALNKKYLSPNLKKLPKENDYNFTPTDLAIITLLAEGKSQKEIPSSLHLKNVKSCSLSSVEKSLKNMKEVLMFTKNEQLIAYCKDMGII